MVERISIEQLQQKFSEVAGEGVPFEKIALLSKLIFEAGPNYASQEYTEAHFAISRDFTLAAVEEQIKRYEKLHVSPSFIEKKQKEQALEEEIRSLGLPDIVGSTKQIEWAEDLRMEFLKVSSPGVRRKVVNARICRSAKWWIENRKSLSFALAAVH